VKYFSWFVLGCIAGLLIYFFFLREPQKVTIVTELDTVFVKIPSVIPVIKDIRDTVYLPSTGLISVDTILYGFSEEPKQVVLQDPSVLIFESKKFSYDSVGFSLNSLIKVKDQKMDLLIEPFDIWYLKKSIVAPISYKYWLGVYAGLDFNRRATVGISGAVKYKNGLILPSIGFDGLKVGYVYPIK